MGHAKILCARQWLESRLSGNVGLNMYLSQVHFRSQWVSPAPDLHVELKLPLTRPEGVNYQAHVSATKLNLLSRRGGI